MKMMHRTRTIALRYAALLAGLLAGLGAQSAWAQGAKDEQNHETDLRETITLAGSGATLVGDGKRTRCHSAKSCPDATLYCWRGPQNEPAIHLTGAHTTIGDFGLVGRPNGSKTPKPALAILMDQTGRTGLGNGKHTFLPIVIEEYAVGIQIGSRLGDSNCDECLFESLDIEHCGVAVKSVNTMSMGHVFNRLRVMTSLKDGEPILDSKGEQARDAQGKNRYTPPIGFLYNAGGDLTVNKYAAMGPQTILVVDATSGIGSNNGDYSIRRIKFDNQAGPYGKLLEMRSHSPAAFDFEMSVAYDGYNDDERSGDWLVDARSPAVVTLTGRNYQHRTLRWVSKRGQTTRIIVEAAELACEPWELFDVAGSVGACDVTVTNTCTYFGQGTKCPEYEARLVGTVNSGD